MATNSRIRAALKNALDVGSRPYGMNASSGASPGAIGGFGRLKSVVLLRR
jgi:chromate reductase, NAD(P)H dehydrogenase (quinone)